MRRAGWNDGLLPGPEPALQSVYEISDYAELQAKWLAYARSHASGTLTASSGTPEKAPSVERR